MTVRKVILIATGSCEREALANSVGGVFEAAGVEFLTDTATTDSFTSGRLSLPPPSTLPTRVQRLAKRLIELTMGHRDALVLAVDDLEPENVDQATFVAVLFTRAVCEMLERAYPVAAARAAVAAELRKRASFHLLVPMVEAYFHGDPDAHDGAGASEKSQLDPKTCDVECFFVVDERFTGPEDVTPLVEPNESYRAKSWAKPQRARHPKLYTRFLFSPDDRLGGGKGRYRETKQGVAMLSALQWAVVMANPAAVKFVRALFTDVAVALNVARPFQGEEAPETTVIGKVGIAGGTLRNT